MDGNISDNFNVKRNALYKELVSLMAQGIETDTLSLEESKDASAFIVDHFEKAIDEIELRVLLEKLSTTWPCFEPALLTFENSTTKENDKEKLDVIQNELNNIKVTDQ